jgi:type IV pilus assembly protein PilX
VALAVVLILLLIVTLLALASLRGTLLEQRMSTATVDRALSFQAAEAALREGERVAAAKPIPGANCVNGICPTPVPNATPRWLDTDANWNAWSREVAVVDVAQGPGTARPRFIVELMVLDAIPGADCTTGGDVSPDAACSGRESRYRITARSAAADRAEVVLQSTLAVP